MKIRIIIAALAWIFAQSLYVNAEQDKSFNKEPITNNLETMDLLLTEMENEKDGWEVRSGMIQHAKLMEEAASLMANMDESAALIRKRCADQEGSTTRASKDCRELDSIVEVQQRMMVTLIQHLLIRQNIILRNVGILQKK